MKIQVHPKLDKVLPALKDEEFAELEADIIKHGVKDSIKLWSFKSKFYILDGHNRYRICTTHKPPIKYRTLVEDHVKTLDDAIFYIIKQQLARRNMSKQQRCSVAIEFKEIIQARAKENLKTKSKQPLPNQQRQEIHTHKILAKIAGVGATTMQSFMYIEENKNRLTAEEQASYYAETLSISSAKLMINDRIEKERQQEERMFNYRAYKGKHPLDYMNPRLFNKTFMQALEDGDVPANSIDAVVCDPPYGKYFDETGKRRDWVDEEYESLGAFTSKVLMRGRSAYFLTGQYPLNEAIPLLLSNNELEWRWLMPYLMYGSGDKSDNIKRKIDYIRWKPIICLSKGEPVQHIPQDTLESTVIYSGEPPKKKVYEWMQSLYGFIQLLLLFTKEDDVIVDPTMGMGTTGVACMLTKRRFIGIEKNEYRYKQAAEQISIFSPYAFKPTFTQRNDDYTINLATYIVEIDDMKKILAQIDWDDEHPKFKGVRPRGNIIYTPGLKHK